MLGSTPKCFKLLSIFFQKKPASIKYLLLSTSKKQQFPSLPLKSGQNLKPIFPPFIQALFYHIFDKKSKNLHKKIRLSPNFYQ